MNNASLFGTLFLITSETGVPLGWGVDGDAEPCEGDFDGDGMIGASDILHVLGGWGTYGANDILLVIANWGGDC